ncbi:MAG: hypothetical protein GY847_25790 [Proteobacteria bacterium]|nr:hypothetical protein [Pseudomonadota bacterium]
MNNRLRLAIARKYWKPSVITWAALEIRRDEQMSFEFERCPLLLQVYGDVSGMRCAFPVRVVP